MSNNLGVLNVTLIVQKALERLRTQHPQLFSFARNFSDSKLKKGDTLTVKVPGAMTAAEFDGTSFAAQAATLADATIAITKHLHATFKLTEDERAKGAKNFEEDLIQAVVDAIADKIYSDLFGFVTTGGADPSIASARVMVKTLAQFDRKSIVGMGTLCNKLKLSKSGRFAILDSDYHGELFGDESIVGALINPNAGQAVTEGVLPKIHGFAVSEYTDLQNTGAPHNIAGVFGHLRPAGAARQTAPAGAPLHHSRDCDGDRDDPRGGRVCIQRLAGRRRFGIDPEVLGRCRCRARPGVGVRVDGGRNSGSSA